MARLFLRPHNLKEEKMFKTKTAVMEKTKGGLYEGISDILADSGWVW